jgi:hypothetical protein
MILKWTLEMRVVRKHISTISEQGSIAGCLSRTDGSLVFHDKRVCAEQLKDLLTVQKMQM